VTKFHTGTVLTSQVNLKGYKTPFYRFGHTYCISILKIINIKKLLVLKIKVSIQAIKSTERLEE